MILKEAYRYQNILNSLSERVEFLLSQNSNLMTITQNHQYHKVNESAEDEKIVVERQTPYSPKELIGFAIFLAKEKINLINAIDSAKRYSSSISSIDAFLAENKVRQNLASTLRKVCGIRPSERSFASNSFKFNAEGNQVLYTYEVKEVSVIDFDRSDVRHKMDIISEEADKASVSIERAMLEISVDYYPFFSTNDSFDDAMERYIDESNGEHKATE